MDDENRYEAKPEELVAEDVADDFPLFGKQHPREFDGRIRKMLMGGPLAVDDQCEARGGEADDDGQRNPEEDGPHPDDPRDVLREGDRVVAFADAVDESVEGGGIEPRLGEHDRRHERDGARIAEADGFGEGDVDDGAGDALLLFVRHQVVRP